eukprot:354656-Chlamydomonas_euryale.AAC.6
MFLEATVAVRNPTRQTRPGLHLTSSLLWFCNAAPWAAIVPEPRTRCHSRPWGSRTKRNRSVGHADKRRRQARDKHQPSSSCLPVIMEFYRASVSAYAWRAPSVAGAHTPGGRVSRHGMQHLGRRW